MSKLTTLEIPTEISKQQRPIMSEEKTVDDPKNINDETITKVAKPKMQCEPCDKPEKQDVPEDAATSEATKKSSEDSLPPELRTPVISREKIHTMIPQSVWWVKMKQEQEKIKVLNPYLSFEEDLEFSTQLTPEIIERIKSYTPVVKRVKKPPCHCQKKRPSGRAPRIPMRRGPDMPMIGLGTWFGLDWKGAPVTVDNKAIQEAVSYAIVLGYRHINTSPGYDTDAAVGRAIKKSLRFGKVKRDELFITTSLSNTAHGKGQVVPALKQSLKNLNLDYVDLYLMEWPMSILEDGTYGTIDYVDTWKEMLMARDMGLTKAAGVCNFNVSQLERIEYLTPELPAALQVEVNLNIQQPELQFYCKTHGIALIGCSPFGSIFSKKAAPSAPRPRENEPIILKIVMKYKKTLPQIILRYLMDMGVAPIPKSVANKHLERNINVFDFSLTREEREILKQFDCGYRTLKCTAFKDHPYYPFEK